MMKKIVNVYYIHSKRVVPEPGAAGLLGQNALSS
jgi:hypothetical protein